MGQGLPLHMIGDARRGTAVPQWGVGFGGDTDEHDLWMYDGMRAMAATPAGRGAWHDVVAGTVRSVDRRGPGDRARCSPATCPPATWRRS